VSLLAVRLKLALLAAMIRPSLIPVIVTASFFQHSNVIVARYRDVIQNKFLFTMRW
jgi:hypothetical protein